jgi:hypothetical protein
VTGSTTIEDGAPRSPQCPGPTGHSVRRHRDALGTTILCHFLILVVFLNLCFIFRFREIRKKPKNPYFWLPQQKMGSMGGTFTIPEFNSSYTNTDSNLVRIGDKKFLEKNHVPPLLSNFHFGKSFKRP